MKVLKYATLAVLSFPLFLVAAYFAWKWIDNVRFASVFFEDKVEIVRVVASKRWHDSSDQGIACTYAAVEFSEATADRLRAHGPKALVGKGWRRGGQQRWDVRWKPTPTQAPVKIRIEDSSWWCLKFLPERERDQVMDSLSKPGSWYYQRGEISTVLTAEHRLAVTLRFGD